MEEGWRHPFTGLPALGTYLRGPASGRALTLTLPEDTAQAASNAECTRRLRLVSPQIPAHLGIELGRDGFFGDYGRYLMRFRLPIYITLTGYMSVFLSTSSLFHMLFRTISP